MRNRRVCLFVSTITMASAIVSGQAPSTQTPRTYSLTLSMAGGVTVKIARDGTKESVEQMVPKSAYGPGMHIRLLYDFAARKLWTLDLDGGPCTVVAYTSPNAPSEFDPVGAAAEMREELRRAKPAVLRTETVNGIATNVYEVPVPEIKGKMRLFLEEKHDFPVKIVMLRGDGAERTEMEITEMSFAKPAADLFAPPSSCQVLAGETTATGGHAETNIDVTTKGAGRNAAAAPPAPEAAASVPRDPEIRIVGWGVSPSHYTGPAPAAFQFSFEIAATGPVEADWVLVSQGDTAWESGKIVFDSERTKMLNVPVKVGVGNGTHWEGAGHLEIVIGAKRLSSTTVPVSADCRAK